MFFILLLLHFSLVGMEQKDILDRIGEVTLVSNDKFKLKIPKEEVLRLNYFSVIKTMLEDCYADKEETELQEIKLKLDCDVEMLKMLWEAMSFLVIKSEENQIKFKEFMSKLSFDQTINLLNAAEKYENLEIREKVVPLLFKHLKNKSEDEQKAYWEKTTFPLKMDLMLLKTLTPIDLWHKENETISKIVIHPKFSLVAHLSKNKMVGISDDFKIKDQMFFSNQIKIASWHPLKKVLALMDAKGKIFVWNLENRKVEFVETYECKRDELDMKFYADKGLIFYYRDPLHHPVRSIDIEKPINTTRFDFLRGRVFVSQDMNFFAVGNTKSLEVINPIKLCMGTIPIDGKIVSCISWAHHEKNLFAYGLMDGTVGYVVAGLKKTTGEKLENKQNAMSHLEWHPSKKLLAALGANEIISIWDFNTAKKEQILLKSNCSGYITSLVWFSEQEKCVTLDNTGGLEMWDYQTKKSSKVKTPLSVVKSITSFKNNVIALGQDPNGEFKIHIIEPIPLNLDLEKSDQLFFGYK